MALNDAVSAMGAFLNQGRMWLTMICRYRVRVCGSMPDSPPLQARAKSRNSGGAGRVGSLGRCVYGHEAPVGVGVDPADLRDVVLGPLVAGGFDGGFEEVRLFQDGVLLLAAEGFALPAAAAGAPENPADLKRRVALLTVLERWSAVDE